MTTEEKITRLNRKIIHYTNGKTANNLSLSDLETEYRNLISEEERNRITLQLEYDSTYFLIKDLLLKIKAAAFDPETALRLERTDFFRKLEQVENIISKLCEARKTTLTNAWNYNERALEMTEHVLNEVSRIPGTPGDNQTSSAL